jgi:hypothetical protein
MNAPPGLKSLMQHRAAHADGAEWRRVAQLRAHVSVGNGIYLFDHEGRGARYAVAGNTLDIANPCADGVVLDGTGAIAGPVVQGNRIAMHDTCYGAITMVDNVSNALIGDNTCSNIRTIADK